MRARKMRTQSDTYTSIAAPGNQQWAWPAAHVAGQAGTLKTLLHIFLEFYNTKLKKKKLKTTNNHIKGHMTLASFLVTLLDLLKES